MQVRPGLSNLAMKLFGPCTLIQAALPSIIEDTPQSFLDHNLTVFEVKRNCTVCRFNTVVQLDDFILKCQNEHLRHTHLGECSPGL